MATNLPALLEHPAFERSDYDPGTAMRARMRTAMIAFAVLLFGFGAAAAFVPIGGAVVGTGQVGVESRIKRVAHPVGGIISEILVENGDRVRRGQILMRLDDTVTGTDADLSALTVDQLLAQRARLEAERLGAASINFPAELRRRGDAAARQAMADESRLFAIRRSEASGMLAQLSSRVRQYQNQIDGYQAQISALRQQQALLEPERAGVRELWEQDLVTINRLNQLERTSVDLDGNIAALNATIAQTQARITEAREQMIQLADTRRSDAGAQLTALNAQLNEQQVRRVSAGDVQERSTIRAPHNGTVDKLTFTTVGDVIRPAETIMEIVPDNDRLIVEAAISPVDIDQVRTGQRARVRLSAFSMTTTPEIEGRVIFVAPERTTDRESGASFYAVRIEMDEGALSRERQIELRPGMPAEIFIETGSRSMLSYLTKPLRDQLARAFRDN